MIAQLPWEAIVTLVLAAIALIAGLTKISVMQDVGNDKLKEINDKVNIIESTYVKTGDFSWLKEKVETGLRDINDKIHKLNEKPSR